ncbi:hypothetical protein ACFYOB_24575, partial [Streptomyces sp. NPDC006463]
MVAERAGAAEPGVGAADSVGGLCSAAAHDAGTLRAGARPPCSSEPPLPARVAAAHVGPAAGTVSVAAGPGVLAGVTAASPAS